MILSRMGRSVLPMAGISIAMALQPIRPAFSSDSSSANGGSRGTVLVTGGSRGIGAACCRRLASDGYSVVVNYRSSEHLAEALVAELTSKGARAVAIKGDVGSEEGVASLFEELDKHLQQQQPHEGGGKKFPSLTALVNNAGVLGPNGCDLNEVGSSTALASVFNTNVLGPLLCCKEAAKRMPKGSAIVNVSSGSATLGKPLLYAMSKGALNSLQHGLIGPLAEQGIRINTVSPGVTETDMVKEVMVGGFDMKTIPLGRLGQPGEIAGAVAYLLSPDASYVSGANIRVSGGKGPGTTIG